MEIPAARNPVDVLREAFGEAILSVKEFRGETTIVVDAARATDVLDFLRVSSGLVYNMLSDVSAVDYYPSDYGEQFDGGGSDYRPERFAVSYHILSMLYNRRLRVKVFADEEDPRLPTATVIFPAANWLEREIADMMGIIFEGHPDQRRLLMPDNWYGHPHRRDYPLGKETVAFSFNEAEISKHKPFATD
ncbi:MAG: NADH-quinone oxidoreductase subunit C [Chloroflexi bacterium]|nr:NADH-quinone oxidoreductase subunit C [Chloroflexota bacterium]